MLCGVRMCGGGWIAISRPVICDPGLNNTSNKDTLSKDLTASELRDIRDETMFGLQKRSNEICPLEIGEN